MNAGGHNTPNSCIYRLPGFYSARIVVISDEPINYIMPLTLSKLQNGSDIRGVALSGIPGEPVTLTNDIAYKIGDAFVSWLSGSTKLKEQDLIIGLGNDPRLSGPGLKQAFASACLSRGCKVYDFGLATTPSMFMATQLPQFSCHGAVMFTASHLPWNRNGLKFFTQEAGLEKNDIKAILDLAEKSTSAPVPSENKVVQEDILLPYSNYLVEAIKKSTGDPAPLAGKKIVVDAGNGSGGFFAKQILEPLGAITTGSQFLDPNGEFPNHIPNPEDETAIKSIQMAVLENNAELGIIFDTDVDRAAVVDHQGQAINRNRLIGLMAAIMLEEYPGSTIVTDSVTSDGLSVFINDLGGIHHRFKRGYKNVINEAKRLNEEGTASHLAIETSGHGAIKENYFLDDGCYMVAKILTKMAKLSKENKSIADLIANLKEAPDSKEYRLTILTTDFKEYGTQVIEALASKADSEPHWTIDKENREGIRIQYNKDGISGWFLLRLSLHDPVLPLNIEADKAGGVEKIANDLRAFLKNFDQLKNTSLI